MTKEDKTEKAATVEQFEEVKECEAELRKKREQNNRKIKLNWT